MKIFKNNDSVKTHSGLKAPSSLPDTFIEQYGFENSEEVKKESGQEDVHPQKIPEVLEEDKHFFDKIQEHSSVEFIKEKPEEEKSEPKKEDENIKEEALDKENQDVPPIKRVSTQKIIPQDEVEKSKKVEIEIEKKEEKSVSHPSFFAELEKLLSTSKKYSHTNFSENLVDMMKKFHVTRSRGEHFFFHEQELEDALYKKMLKLKEIEKEWIVRAKEFNSAKELLEEKEKEIDKVSEDLKMLIKKADRYKLFSREVPHDKAFHLINRKILVSINDLIHELDRMSDDVFNHHVNSRKNDFSMWIAHVFKEKNLAEELRKRSNRDDLLYVLRNY